MKFSRTLKKLIPAPLRENLEKQEAIQHLSKSNNTKIIFKHQSSYLLCNLDNKIEKKVIDGGYDTTNLALVNMLVQPGHTCLDVGANIGAYSVILSKLCGPLGQVYAFEPVNHIRNKLNKNLAINGARNVTVNNVGLGNEDATINMHQVKDGVFRAGTSSFVKNSTISKMGDDKFDISPTRVTKVDTYISESKIDKIDFIKIDVEGFELNVLLGGKESISKFRPAIIMEFDYDRHNEESVNFSEFFSAVEYEIFHCYSLAGRIAIEPFDFSFQPKERNLLCLPTL